MPILAPGGPTQQLPATQPSEASNAPKPTSAGVGKETGVTHLPPVPLRTKLEQPCNSNGGTISPKELITHSPEENITYIQKCYFNKDVNFNKPTVEQKLNALNESNLGNNIDIAIVRHKVEAAVKNAVEAQEKLDEVINNPLLVRSTALVLAQKAANSPNGASTNEAINVNEEMISNLIKAKDKALNELIAVIVGPNFKDAVNGPGFNLVKSWFHDPSSLQGGFHPLDSIQSKYAQLVNPSALKAIQLAQKMAIEEIRKDYN
jgi:hypothetical protein